MTFNDNLLISDSESIGDYTHARMFHFSDMRSSNLVKVENNIFKNIAPQPFEYFIHSDYPMANAIFDKNIFQGASNNVINSFISNLRNYNKDYSRIERYGDGPPGDGTYWKGDIIWNQNPDPGEFIGWICVGGDGSNGGNWRGFGQISQQ